MNLLLLVLTITLVPKYPTTPTIKPQNDGSYVAFNPLKKSVEMTIDCGRDFDQIHLVVGAEHSLPFSVVMDKDAIAVGCSMESFKTR